MSAPSEYQDPGRGQGGGVEGQRRIATRTLTSANLEPIAEELLFGQAEPVHAALAGATHMAGIVT